MSQDNEDDRGMYLFQACKIGYCPELDPSSPSQLPTDQLPVQEKISDIEQVQEKIMYLMHIKCSINHALGIHSSIEYKHCALPSAQQASQ